MEQLPTRCWTGNCTYPVTSSVGVCGACSNITNLLNNTEPCGSDASCYYSLPNNITLASVATDSWKPPVFLLQSGSTGMYADNDTIYMYQFFAIGVPYSMFPDGFNTIAMVEAYECALWFCLQGQSGRRRDSGSTGFLANLNNRRISAGDRRYEWNSNPGSYRRLEQDHTRLHVQRRHL